MESLARPCEPLVALALVFVFEIDYALYELRGLLSYMVFTIFIHYIVFCLSWLSFETKEVLPKFCLGLGLTMESVSNLHFLGWD